MRVEAKRLRSLGLEKARTDGSHHGSELRRRMAIQGRIVTISQRCLSADRPTRGRSRGAGSSGSSHGMCDVLQGVLAERVQCLGRR